MAFKLLFFLKMFRRVVQSSPYSQPGPVHSSGCVCTVAKGSCTQCQPIYVAAEGVSETTESSSLSEDNKPTLELTTQICEV